MFDAVMQQDGIGEAVGTSSGYVAQPQPTELLRFRRQYFGTRFYEWLVSVLEDAFWTHCSGEYFVSIRSHFCSINRRRIATKFAVICP